MIYRVICNEIELRYILDYIEENPAKWTEDCYFAQSTGELT